MDISQEYIKSQKYSVISVDNLNHDCFEAIFKLLPLRDLLQLRYLNRSLNNAVCQYLQTYRKFAFFLDVDLRGVEPEKVPCDLLNEFPHWRNLWNKRFERSRNVRCINYDSFPRKRLANIIPWDTSLLRSQIHFRSEDLIYIDWFEESLDRKLNSLVLFLTANMTHLTKFALLIKHEHYFRFVARLLSPLRKLKVLLIDLACPLPRAICRQILLTDILDAISGLPELESLYFLRCEGAKVLFDLKDFRNGSLQKLSNGQNFMEGMLRRLRVLHCHGFAFPDGMAFDNLVEISVSNHQEDAIIKNYFPAVERLFSHSVFRNPYSQLGDERFALMNVKVLEMYGFYFSIGNSHLRRLNELPNLREVHCGTFQILGSVRSITQRNYTIERLYSEVHPYRIEVDFGEDSESDMTRISDKVMNKYVATCKKYLQGLRLLKIERPEKVVEFPPVVEENRMV